MAGDFCSHYNRRQIAVSEAAALPTQSTVVHTDSDILGGIPVFVGTRVPLQNLIDYLEAGSSIDEFLVDFPSVSRELVIGALEFAKEALAAHARTSR